MTDYYVYEHITPAWGNSYDEYLGVVQARTEQSALNKAKQQYKYNHGGVPARRRIADNFWATPLFGRRTK